MLENTIFYMLILILISLVMIGAMLLYNSIKVNLKERAELKKRKNRYISVSYINTLIKELKEQNSDYDYLSEVNGKLGARLILIELLEKGGFYK